MPYCRLCRAELPREHGFWLHNVPRGVQCFLEEGHIAADAGVDLEFKQCVYCHLVQLCGEHVLYEEAATSATSYSPSISRYRQQQALDFVHRFELQGRTVLDAGCGDGYFLSYLAEAGVHGVGVELSRKAVGIGVERGLTIHRLYLDSGCQIPGAPFDGFTSFHVLEHTADPNEFLRGIRTNVRENAVGMITVPAWEQIKERSRYYDLIADHLCYFSERTLRLALEINGFSVISIDRDWNGEDLVALVRSTSASDIDILSPGRERVLQACESFFVEATGRGRVVAVWGASQQAVTVLALKSWSCIRYVVDSALYKQGRFTPVSHLPIIGPQQFAQDSVDDVLVIAPRFTGEIVEQLRGTLKFRGRVAVLEDDHIRDVP
jgi:SAM-dependent methyltransferase